jgi:hypothetical protein
MNLSDRINQRINDNKKVLQWLEEVLLEVDEPEKLEITITNDEIRAVCTEVFLAHELLSKASALGCKKLISVYIGSERYGNTRPWRSS